MSETNSKETCDDRIPEVLRLSLPSLINTARELIHNLTSFQSDGILDSQTNLNGFLHTIEKLEEEYLHQGTEGILSKIKNAVTKIETIIERSNQLGTMLNINVYEFIEGRKDELENLGKTLVNVFKDSSTKVINTAIESVNADIKTVTNISNDIVGLPGKLSSSLITWNPLPKITELIDNLTAMIEKLPDQIKEIISKNTSMVNNVPNDLLKCVSTAIEETENRANEILAETAANIARKSGEAIIDYLLG